MMTVYVCVGSACHVHGGYSVISTLQSLIEEKGLGEKVTVKAVLCLGNCSQAVSVKIDDGEVISVKEKSVKDFFEKYIIEKL